MSDKRLILPTGPIDNFGPYLGGLLKLKNKVMTLSNHFVFWPLFAVALAPYVVIRAGRQLGKSQQMTARLILQAAFRPGQETLVVLPLQEQSDRLSSLIFKPMIEDSPISSILKSDPNLGSIRRREFLNRSLIHFSYAFLDAERVRSISSSILYVDEAADMDPAHMPVLRACLDGAEEPVVMISGSAKTTDTTLEQAFNRSSQGVWHIKCPCGFDNICCLEPHGHMLAMLGKYREDISIDRPGLICKGCALPVSPRRGRWVHRYPERQDHVVGYHIPQPIMPGHCERPIKWRLLLDKMNGGEGFTTAKFYNEVLGESFDSAFKLVSTEDLIKAAVGLGKNDEVNLAFRADQYTPVILGVDWGGGGDSGMSRTKIAAMGMSGMGDLHVFGGMQFPPTTDRVEEARQILDYARRCRAQIIAHDYNGAGTTAENIFTHLGWPENRLVPIQYSKVPGGKMIHSREPGLDGGRRYYVVDKSRSLQFTCQAIRQLRVRFFDYDRVDDHRPGLLSDFTNLVEDHLETPSGAGVYRIRKSSDNVSDDFAHAVNYGACALWEYTRSWPDLAVAGRVRDHAPGD